MRKANHRIIPVLIVVFISAWAASADADEASGYPYDLVTSKKSPKTASVAALPEESEELAQLRALDLALFPPSGAASEKDPSGFGGEFVVHDGPAENFMALLGSPIPKKSAPKTPVALLSKDLAWLANLTMPDLPVRWDDRVVVYLDRFRNEGKWRKIIRSWMSRTERYGPLMRAELGARSMPEDMLYLSMIESAYNPRAVSSAGAVGLWQFMPATGDGFGLTRTKWVDQRRNPELSTVAAAAYLSALHKKFGSWDLAMAAYNMGPGALMSSIKKYNTNDYWKLAGYEAGLPWGTTNYVPKILAAAIVGKNREAFGLDDLKNETPITYDVAIVPVSVKLSKVAKAAGVETSKVAKLNPELLKSRVPPDMLPYPVRIPEGSGVAFDKGWPAVAAKAASLQLYEVKFGDTLSRIAKLYGTSVKELSGINDIAKKDLISAGDEILVPSGDPVITWPEEVPTVGVPAVQFVYPGHRRVFYEIIKGDTLSAIAVFFGVTVTDLATWNDLDSSAKIHSGMWLQIFVVEDRDLGNAVILEEDTVVVYEVGGIEFLEWMVEQAGKERIVHTVTQGETLKSISKKYGVKVSNIVRINQFGYGTDLTPGQEIVLYVEKEND